MKAVLEMTAESNTGKRNYMVLNAIRKERRFGEPFA
jgi:hypothetical protein